MKGINQSPCLMAMLHYKFSRLWARKCSYYNLQETCFVENDCYDKLKILLEHQFSFSFLILGGV